jgi:tetratricopeptide (TPR) repeat protein
MKKLLIAALVAVISQLGFARLAQAQLTSTPSGGNKKASVTEMIGITDVTINYSRPHVNKRDGHIWGELVYNGYADLGFGTSKAAPWRAGANENTTIEFSTDVKVEGQPLAAGKYGFFIAYGADESTLIFSKNATSWGSFFYNPAEDALRVKVKPVPAANSEEWLKYEFTGQTATSAVVQLQWEKMIIPFKIDVDLPATQLAIFRKELRTDKGFSWQSWEQAAAFCAQNKTNLEEGLLWADTATSVNFGGNQVFQAWKTKASILEALGRGAEATATIKKALPYANMNELYFYGKSLIAEKKGEEALEVFKLDYQKHPDDFLTNTGMARGYMAVGDNKKALPYALKAQKQVVGKINKDTIDKMVATLQAAK